MITFDDSLTNEQLSKLHSREAERRIMAQAAQLGYPSIDLHGYTINPEALASVREDKARAAELVAFELKRDQISVAVTQPDNPKVQEIIQELQKRKFQVSVYMCSHSSLEHTWARYKDVNATESEAKGVFEISAEDIIRLSEEIKTYTDIDRLLQQINSTQNVRRISQTLELMFAGALALKASDIHIEPEEETIRLRYRLDGVLHDIVGLDPYIYQRLMSRLKLLAGMIINSRAEAQDGRLTFDIGDREIEVRASVIPGALGESIVMRLLDPKAAGFSIDKIDLNPYIEKVIRNELKKPNGLIITTGPTGSGKTTALYAFLRETHTEGVKIITIENPVEYKLSGIVQTQTGEDYTFASGLRAILRQDPDIIMVGEIRDREVAETAIHAAQTGHLVFSTLHTNSARAGFARLIDLGIDPRVMGTSINMIIGQRLVRVLCKHCKTSYQAPEDEQRIIEYTMSTHPYPIEIPDPLMLYRPNGCAECGNTGFKGRNGIFEAVVMDEAVEEVVLRDPREHSILEASRPQKIPTMLEDGIEKVVRGITSLRELERVIELPYITAVGSALPTIPEGQDDPREAEKIDISEHTV